MQDPPETVKYAHANRGQRERGFALCEPSHSVLCSTLHEDSDVDHSQCERKGDAHTRRYPCQRAQKHSRQRSKRPHAQQQQCHSTC